MEKCDNQFAADETAAGESDIDQPENLPPSRRLGPFTQLSELSSDVGCANQRADGGATNDIGFYARLRQRIDDADVRPAPR